MGLLDYLDKQGEKISDSPWRQALIAYGTTGQGHNPGGTAAKVLMSGMESKRKRKREQAKLDKQQAMQNQVLGQFSGGGLPDMPSLAQYAMAGGQGAGDLLNMYKFGKQGVKRDAGAYYDDPVTGQRQYMPKLGTGMVIGPGGEISNAPGYVGALGQAEGAKQWAGVDPAIAQHGGKAGIDYGYDLGKMREQAQVDVQKYGAQQDIGYGYDVRRMGAQAELDPMTAYNPQTGGQEYVSRGQLSQGGYQVAKPESEKIYSAERAKQDAARYQEISQLGSESAQQLGKINQLQQLSQAGLATGTLQPVFDVARGVAAQAGIDVEGLDDRQVASKMLLQLSQDIPLPPGAASNVDVQQRLAQLPQMTDTPEAFQRSLDLMQELAEMNQYVADAVRQQGRLTPEIEAQISELYSTWGA